jgi:hypothetical protein
LIIQITAANIIKNLREYLIAIHAEPRGERPFKPRPKLGREILQGRVKPPWPRHTTVDSPHNHAAIHTEQALTN